MSFVLDEGSDMSEQNVALFFKSRLGGLIFDRYLRRQARLMARAEGKQMSEENVEQKLELQPITFREACAYVEKYHRHHRPPQGHKFSIAVNDGEKIVGVVMVGRPVSRHLDDGWTAEVTRCCTTGTPNTNSILYAAAWRAARGMGYRKLITYILDSEPGTSLRAAGWKLIGKRGGGSWSRPGRPRVDTHPTGQKLLFEVMA